MPHEGWVETADGSVLIVLIVTGNAPSAESQESDLCIRKDAGMCISLSVKDPGEW